MSERAAEVAFPEEKDLFAAFQAWRRAWAKTHPGYRPGPDVRDAFVWAFYAALRVQEELSGTNGSAVNGKRTHG